MLTQEELDKLDDWMFDDERLVWINSKCTGIMSGMGTLKDVVIRALNHEKECNQ